jgi:membrane protease YdiL (CAAX protease family)
VVLTYSWSWLFWLPAVWAEQQVHTFPVVLLLVLGGLGPPLVAIILTSLTQDAEGRYEYWQRVIDYKRIGVGWYAVIFGLSPVWSVLALVLGSLTQGSPPTWDTGSRWLSQPWRLLPFALSTVVYGPLPEELGWRGYALDRLQGMWSPLTASMILGVVWSGWHLPLFFMDGTYHREELGLGSWRFWLTFCLANIALSMVMTWIYNHTGRSTLSAILFHFMGNFTGEVLNLSDQAEYYRAALTIVTAVGLQWCTALRSSRAQG